jgi:hypothetical protein
MKNVILAAIMACATVCAFPAQGQVVIVFDEALQNGFQNWSYGGGSDFASVAQAHGGTTSVAFTGAVNNAISFVQPTINYATATYPGLDFWIHGGAEGGQQVKLYLQLDNVLVGPGSGIDLDDLIGGVPAGTWKKVSIDLTAPPISYNGTFDRIDIYSEVAAQGVLYVDDMSLGQVVAPPEEPTDVMLIEQGVNVDAMVSERYTWKDSRGERRVAVLAHNVGNLVGGFRGGALRRFEYQLPTGATRSAIVTTYGNAGYGGFGYMVSHAKAPACNNDSPLGGTTAGTFTRVFEGRHHAILRFMQSYPRPCSSAPAGALKIPVVIEWMMRTGADHPLWIGTWHVDQLQTAGGSIQPAGTINDDIRGPYGELAIDGLGFQDIDGVAWGDRYKFTSTTAPVQLNSDWTYDTPNTVPYVKLWLDRPPADPDTTATMGLVQTQTMTQQDAGAGRNPGGYDLSDYWGLTSAAGNAGPGYKMPLVNEWAYQANGFNLQIDNPNNNARLTWGSQYGFLGQSTYVVNDGVVVNAPGYPKKNYSLYVALDTHRRAPVEGLVEQVEVIQGVTLSATTGEVATQGKRGVDDATLATYEPAGYDHVYGALTFIAAANDLTANIEVAAGTLKKPLLVIRNYSAGDPVITFGGMTLVADVDYFASLRPAVSELWLTLNRDVAGGVNALTISSDSNVPAAPVIGAATPGDGTASIEFTPGSDGGSPITGYTVTCTPGPITSNGAGSPIAVEGLTNGITYSCSVVATNAIGDSDPSASVDVTPVAPFGAPTGFTATATSTSVIQLTWTAVGEADSYEIHRQQGDVLTLVTTTALTTHTISSLAANTSYVYRVRAIGLGGESDFSLPDAATTIVFTNDPLATSTSVRAVHFTQLRTATNAMRAAAGLAAQVWTDPGLAAGTLIKGVHLTQLRTGLAEAREVLELPAIVFTDAMSSSLKVKALHVTQLRDGVK